MRAEADQRDDREQRKAQDGADRHAQALIGYARGSIGASTPEGVGGPARARRGEQQERQRQPGGHLDPHARDQCGRATDRRSTRSPIGQQTRVGTGCEHQGGGERQQLEHVVVGAADGQH
jgi:hypothetical protein